MPTHRPGAAVPEPAPLEAHTVAVDTAVLTEVPTEIPAPPPEVWALAAVQRVTNDTPLVPLAKGMSRFGDHALGWLALGAAGALADRPRRRQWLVATAGVAAAHGASVAVKRVVRRPRPDHPDVVVHCGTPSRLSFPSAHATSTTAAALLFGALLGGVGGGVATAVLVPPMAVSRLVLGVHYPTDVVAGAGLGAAVAAAARRWGKR